MNYYNENDPKTAAWLRELIRCGEIPAGDVDTRSIQEVMPHELTRYTQQHFFAGVGGWPLALRLAGWPESKPVRTGSCPCQPFSQTGKQLGTKDVRHLWPVFRDLITFGEATITFGEQVASPLGREWLAGVRADLEGLGYEVGAADLCAAGFGAPHIRQRLYWMAHTNGGKSRNGGIQRGGQHRQQQKNGRTTSGVEHAAGNGREQRRSKSGGRGAASGCGAYRMDYPDSDGAQRTRASEQKFDAGCEIDRLGDTNGSGSQGRNERIFRCDYQWPPGTPNLVVCCEDGKARRFEPGSFPLAHGVPGRVGLLRGYGNAIVPQLAAEFIQACEEAISR